MLLLLAPELGSARAGADAQTVHSTVESQSALPTSLPTPVYKYFAGIFSQAYHHAACAWAASSQPTLHCTSYAPPTGI